MSDAIRIDHLYVSYTSDTPALSDVSLVVPEGDYLGIIGPNGGGKSTLVKAILGLVPIKSGSVWTAPGSVLAYVPQFSTMERDFPITALEVVLCAFLHGGIHPFHRYSQEQIDKAMAYLEQAGLKGLEKRQIGQLSGGERQKLLIARALASDPSILILDEPTSSIDPESRERIYAILGNLAGRITMILITHDTMAISSRVKHIACLNERLFYHGDPEIRSETLGEMYGCSVDLIAHGVPHRVLEEHDHT